MSEPFTPDTERVRESYLNGEYNDGVGRDADPAEFDRWLAGIRGQAITDTAERLGGPIAGYERWADRMSVEGWLRAEGERVTHSMVSEDDRG